MNKNTKFSGSLHKSTKITLLSCVSFIILTMIILAFFILFPITPSERIIASIGRENIFNGNNNGNNVTAIPEVITTTGVSTTAGVNTNPTKSTGTTTTKTFKIVITSGSGFMWNGRIPTGVMNNTKTTPVYADPVYPTRDPGYVYVPPVTQATAYQNNETYPVNTDYPTSTDTVWTDTPSATDTPTNTDPVWTDAPQVTDAPTYTDPIWTEPPIIIDPPSTTHEVVIPVESYIPPQEEYSEW